MNRLLFIALSSITLFALVACHHEGAKKLTVGFSQIGAESEWRTANSQSIKDEAEKQGIALKFSDAQQKQENQIKAIRSFIAAKGRRHRLFARGRDGMGAGPPRGPGREDSGHPH